TKKSYENFISGMRNGKIVQIPDCSHTLPFEVPEKTGDVIIQVLSKFVYEKDIKRTVPEKEGLKYYEPAILINSGAFGLAILHKQVDIVKLLFDAHRINPNLDIDESNVQILPLKK
ncbi:hypothetical protein BB558_003048, partial [Smittium angustum]